MHLCRELERCGINERSVFSDLDGIARSIMRTETLREGKPQNAKNSVAS
jgi:hypothetical protein